MSNGKNVEKLELRTSPKFSLDEMTLINEVFNQDGIVFAAKSHAPLHGIMEKLENFFKSDG